MVLVFALGAFIIGSSFSRSWREAALYPVIFVTLFYLAISQIFGSASLLDNLAVMFTASWLAWAAFAIQLGIASIAGILGFGLARVIRGPVANWRS